MIGLLPGYPAVVWDHTGENHPGVMWLPSNRHSVLSYLLVNNSVIQILTDNLLSCHLAV